MHKDIEFIKYCVNKADGWRFVHNRIYTPHEVIPLKWLSLESPITKVRVWKYVYFPLLLSRTCDALGMYVIETSSKWTYNGTYGGGFYELADEARIAAIKKYMEAEE